MSADTLASKQTDHRRAWLWPTLIVGLLCVHTIGLIFVAFIASSDPSFAVEPDYYAKALAWDESRKDARDPALDGFELTTHLRPVAGKQALGHLTLEVHRDQQAVEGLTVEAIAYHIGRADDRQAVVLTESAPGVYAAEVNLRRDGRWEARYLVTTPDRVYAFSKRMEVYGSSP